MSTNPLTSMPIFEHRENGFGIGHSRPRLSWRFSYPESVEPVKDWTQASYELEVRYDGSDDTESHLVPGPQSTLVPWPGRTLSTGDAISSLWSPWVQAECTLLSHDEWKATPVSTSVKYEAEGPTLRPVRFRKTFSLPSDRKGVKARLYVTTHGLYEIHLNGSRVGDHILAPGWTSYNHRLGFQTFNLTELLVPGDNCIAAEVAEGWYAGKMGIRGGRPFNYGTEVAALAQLEMTLDSGERRRVMTDTDWKCHPSAIQTRKIYHGEVCDLTGEEFGWKTVDLDDRDWDTVKEVPFKRERLYAPGHPPIRVTQEVRPIEIITTPSGKTILDFGQNLAGVPCIRHLPPNSHITLRHAEVLVDGELGVRPIRAAKCTDSIKTGALDVSNWMPKFTYRGFRFMQIEGWDHAPLSLDDIVAKVLHTDMQRRRWFKCSDPLVNKLHEKIIWSMRGNFLSVPTDCPQRDERLGWTGDIQVFGPTANFLYDTMSILSNWLGDVDAEQMAHPQKIPGLVVPNVMGEFWTPTPQAASHDVVILTPWHLFQSSGDAEIL